MRLRVLAHLLMEVGVGEQVKEMLGDLVVVTRSAEVSTLAVDDLEGDTASSGGDDGDTGVDGLGDLDFETFTGGELKSDVGVVQKSVQDCIGAEISAAPRALRSSTYAGRLGESS